MIVEEEKTLSHDEVYPEYFKSYNYVKNNVLYGEIINANNIDSKIQLNILPCILGKKVNHNDYINDSINILHSVNCHIRNKLDLGECNQV